MPFLTAFPCVASSFLVRLKSIWQQVVPFSEAWILLVSARLICNLVPFGRIYNVAGQSHKLAPNSVAAHKIERIRQAVHRASARVPRSTCLTRGLAAAVLLRAAGVPYQLMIGVAKQVDGALTAHAWVMSGETIVMGNLPDLSDYMPLPIESARQSLPSLNS